MKLNTSEEIIKTLQDNPSLVYMDYDMNDIDVYKTYLEIHLGDYDFLKYKENPLKFKPDELKSKEDYIEALKVDCRAIAYIPQNLLDEEIFWEAVKSDGFNLRFVPEEMKNRELCLEAFKSNEFDSYDYIPEVYKTQDFYEEAIKLNNSTYSMILDDENISNEVKRKLCLDAISINFDNIELTSISEELKDKDFYMVCLSNDPRVTLEDIIENEHLNKEEMVELATKGLEADHTLFSMIPKELRNKIDIGMIPDEEKFLYYVKNLDLFEDKYIFAKLSDTIKNEEIIIKAIDFNNEIIQYIPGELYNEKIANAIVEINPVALNNIPEKFKTYELCLRASILDPHSIYSVPLNYITKEFYIEFINNTDKGQLSFLSDEVNSYDTFIESIS
ncbi:DUF4116 domain-containing protein [Brassicibacter mesophilus]|uniref:DUF4116 domain-containing protein n=1 Tax=Brassicibacter mesophilus TaxID=745119 RepID=UPI003D23C7BF